MSYDPTTKRHCTSAVVYPHSTIVSQHNRNDHHMATHQPAFSQGKKILSQPNSRSSRHSFRNGSRSPLTPVHPLPYPATCICFDTKPRLFSRYKASGGRRVVLAQRNPIRSNSFDVKADPCLTVMYVTVAGSLSYEASIAQCNKFEKFI